MLQHLSTSHTCSGYVDLSVPLSVMRHCNRSSGRRCCAAGYHSPQSSTSLLDNSLHYLHSGILLIITHIGVFHPSLLFSTQLAPIVGLYFPPSFIQVGKYVSEDDTSSLCHLNSFL